MKSASLEDGLRPSAGRIALQAVRPRTLGAAVVPVLVGSAVAYRVAEFRLSSFCICILVALLLQIAANLINDAADSEAGIDHAGRKGPLRVSQAGWVRPQSLYWIAGALILAAGLVALPALFEYGSSLLMLGLLSATAAAVYSLGKYSAASVGLGEVAAFLFFGPVPLMGSFYVHAGYIEPLSFWLSLPVALLVANIMASNNLRDWKSDSLAEKKTLVVRLGPQRVRSLALILTALAYAMLVGPAYSQRAFGLLIPILSLPLAFSFIRSLYQQEVEEISNESLVAAVKLHLVFGVLLAVGSML